MDRTPESSDKARKLSLRKVEEQLKGSLEKLLKSNSEDITHGGQQQRTEPNLTTRQAPRDFRDIQRDFLSTSESKSPGEDILARPKFYAVANGRNVGIFDNWREAKRSTN